jgi:hypothetical protein
VARRFSGRTTGGTRFDQFSYIEANMFSCQGSFRKLLLSALGVAIVAAAAPSSAVGSDKIAVNAKSVFEKAGGTSKYGLSQKQLQAADAIIAAALDRLARDGTLGGATPPAVVIKRDLSKKEMITYAEFLDYFRGLVSEQDLKIRRALVDQALAQSGAAQAAADAAAAEARRAAAIAEIDRDPSGYDAKADGVRLENIILQQRNAELLWYLQHPNQVVPHPETNASNRQPTSGQNTAAANGTGSSPAKGTDATPIQPTNLGRPIVHRPPVVTANPPNPPRTGGGAPPGPKAAAPAGSPPPKDDKKPDDKSKK